MEFWPDKNRHYSFLCKKMFKYRVLRELKHSTSLQFKRKGEKKRIYVATTRIHVFHMQWQSHLKLTMNWLGTDFSARPELWRCNDACSNECEKCIFIINKTLEYEWFGGKQKTMLWFFKEVFRGIYVFHIYVLYAGILSESNSPHARLTEETIQWSPSHFPLKEKYQYLSTIQKYSVIKPLKILIFMCRGVINSKKQKISKETCMSMYFLV